MRSTNSRAAIRAARTALAIFAVLLLGYLVLLALDPAARLAQPEALRWFGSPGSVPTIAVVVAVLVILAGLILHTRGIRETGAPVAVVAGLAMISLVLGLASYWDCHDETHPRFFTALMWTANLVKGGIGEQSIATGRCPSSPPVALEIARLAALAAVFLSVVGVAAALFRSGVDRLRLRFARSVTAIVDADDDAESMVGAIADTIGGGTLALITSSPTGRSAEEARNRGGRVIQVDFGDPDTLTELPLWDKLDKLYLLGADPAANLARLQLITERMSQRGPKQRIPLIVRIDDPWQAAAWRAQQFGGSQTRWAADTVGKYEVTAERLLDWITAEGAVGRILVCGSSQLTLALCADMARRQLEQDYRGGPSPQTLPQLTLVSEDAQDAKRDHEFSRAQLGLPPDRPNIEAVAAKPTVALLMSLLSADPRGTSVIVVDSPAAAIDSTIGTRIAAHFPDTTIYAWDPGAELSDHRPSVVGRLRTYQLGMDVPEGQAHDSWERAARLIHDRYVAETDRHTPATRPWAELNEFYRGSNRREVVNALWMAEKIGGHTWNTFGAPPDPTPTSSLDGEEPLEQLRLMGFDRETALAMARAEHEDWCRYYREAGWRYGPVRDDDHKIHDKLMDWARIESDPVLLDTALSSLATTLLRLRQLGYRSRPVDAQDSWESFRRTGTVVAERRSAPWTWRTRSGHTMTARAGDWAVRDPDGDQWWSVKDDIFTTRYQPVDGRLWRRHGTVRARPARPGETMHTLEGEVTAEAGDWVVQGEGGERWTVPADEFGSRYERPIHAGPSVGESVGEE
ncbi:MAG: hypothetical protein U0R66_01585 [Mycobacterium sp.]